MKQRAAGFVIFRRVCEQFQYLLLQASYGSHHWSPPKGHVDKGEDDFATALRETKEESGYGESDLKIYKEVTATLNYNVKGVPKVVVYWLAELIDPEKDPVLSEEHEAFKWLPKEEAKTTATYKDFGEMLEDFENKIKEIKS
uniref:Bis(5'-nucleosyl)-tetraphosphatase [asymmetrical] n=1 Tax=Tabanus bromius TaxID=304241 RepID=A0A0K8TS11_TABBR